MALQFAVIWYGGRWTMLAPGTRRNRYGSRESAVAAAERLADQARRQGYEVEVLVQDEGGQLSAPRHEHEAPSQEPPNSPA